MITVYVLYSSSLNRLYIGQTEDLERRLAEHLQGVSFYTSRVRDWKLIHQEQYPTRSEAMIREKYLKTYRGRVFLRRVLAGGY
jgi:putative endonuclease